MGTGAEVANTPNHKVEDAMKEIDYRKINWVHKSSNV